MGGGCLPVCLPACLTEQLPGRVSYLFACLLACQGQRMHRCVACGQWIHGWLGGRRQPPELPTNAAACSSNQAAASRQLLLLPFHLPVYSSARLPASLSPCPPLPLPACLPADVGKCLYVSGIPGTGKTATVLEVMRSLKRKR